MKHSNAFEKLCENTKTKVAELSIEELLDKRSRGDQPLLIDVREDHEWEKGHIPGAIHLSRGILERDIEQLVSNQETEIILYCGGGYRSLLAAESLMKMGYRHPCSLAGGWRRWCNLKQPTMAPTGEPLR